MLELLFRGFFEWIYGLILECWEYFSSVLFDLMSLDFAYLETYMPIITTIRQIMLGVGWALLLGNLVRQGKAVIMISSEIPELMGICDRIMVMCEGNYSGEVSREEFSQERIMTLASAIKV